MPDLHFQVEEVLANPNAAVPQLSFRVRIANSEPQVIHSMILRVQIQIEPVRRRYSPQEQKHLEELFGEPERWSKSLHPLLWTNANITGASFTGSTTVEVPVPCSFDFNVAITKYIYGLEGGELPLLLLFSGTVFYAGQVGLQVAQIPWDREATYRLPVRVWKEMMDSYYPHAAWLCIRRDAFEKLYEVKARRGFATWEQTIEALVGEFAEVKS